MELTPHWKFVSAIQSGPIQILLTPLHTYPTSANCRYSVAKYSMVFNFLMVQIYV